MLEIIKYQLRKFWRRFIYRRKIDPALLTPPSAASRKFEESLHRNLESGGWLPHPEYSVFTQYDYRYYTTLKDEYLYKYQCFHAVARTIRPRRIIELGTHAGSGADAYLSGWPEADYIGIDMFGAGIRSSYTGQPWEPYAIAEKLLGSRGFKFRLIRANLRELRELPEQADLVVVDAAHDFDNEYGDLQLALSANPEWLFVDDAADRLNAGAALKRFLAQDLAGRVEYTVPVEYIDGGLVIRLKPRAG